MYTSISMYLYSNPACACVFLSQSCVVLCTVYACSVDLPSNDQIEVIREILDELSTPNRLLLSWLLQHMLNIISKVKTPNLSIQNIQYMYIHRYTHMQTCTCT